jgi:AraC-like DNA-binding protein
VKCYYVYESDAEHLVDDKAFATGCVEIMFNLDGTQWQTHSNGKFIETAKAELWGQVLKPLPLKLAGKSSMLGIRFHPFGAALFFNEEVNLFNDQVIDLRSLMGKAIDDLYQRLQDSTGLTERLELIEHFLLNRLTHSASRQEKTTLVKFVMNELTRDEFFDNIENVAARYGITSRYLQKIFLQYTGLTPKRYAKINRFQKSLVLVGRGDLSLTSIAYQSGYFDQSHFIREFRSFTGITPSGFDGENSSAILASPNQ